MILLIKGKAVGHWKVSRNLLPYIQYYLPSTKQQWMHSCQQSCLQSICNSSQRPSQIQAFPNISGKKKISLTSIVSRVYCREETQTRKCSLTIFLYLCAVLIRINQLYMKSCYIFSAFNLNFSIWSALQSKSLFTLFLQVMVIKTLL